MWVDAGAADPNLLGRFNNPVNFQTSWAWHFGLQGEQNSLKPVLTEQNVLHFLQPILVLVVLMVGKQD